MFDPLWTGIIVLLTSIPWITLLILVYKTPEKVEKWVSMFAKAISWAGLKWEKRAVSGDIQSDLRGFKKEFDSTSSERILPYPIRIKWESKMITPEAFIRKNELFVKMSHHRNQAKNFLYATLIYVEKGLVPESRHLIDKTVRRAMDLAFVRKILTEKKRHDVLQLFFDEIYKPDLNKGSLLEKYCVVFNKLEETGGFSQIALEEFSILNESDGWGFPTEDVFRDTRDFVQMLERFVWKKQGEDVNPNYNGKIIKCTIVLVARPDVYQVHGLSPYLRYIKNSLKEGIKTFYICGIGGANTPIVKRIRDAYESSQDLSIVSIDSYKVANGTTGMCLHLKSKKDN